MLADTTSHVGLLKSLHQEWTTVLGTQEHCFGTLGTWTNQALRHHIQRDLVGDREALDRALLELLKLSKAGDKNSSRMLLQLLLPKAPSLGRRCIGLRQMPIDDAIATAISALWESIHSYPIHRERHVLGNLVLDALSVITTQFASMDRDGLYVNLTDNDDDLDAALNRELDLSSQEPTSDTSASAQLVSVLTWAIDSGALSPDEVRILARAELADSTEERHAQRTALAAELGISRDSVNRRVWRVRSKLVDAVQAHIALHGRW